MYKELRDLAVEDILCHPDLDNPLNELIADGININKVITIIVDEGTKGHQLVPDLRSCLIPNIRQYIDYRDIPLINSAISRWLLFSAGLVLSEEEYAGVMTKVLLTLYKDGKLEGDYSYKSLREWRTIIETFIINNLNGLATGIGKLVLYLGNDNNEHYHLVGVEYEMSKYLILKLAVAS